MDEKMVGLALVIALGVGAQFVAERVKLPSILVLLAVGFLAGPVTHLLQPDLLFADLLMPVVSLATAVVLFEGGMPFDLKELRGVRSEVRNLVTLGLLLTWLGLTASVWWLFDFEWRLSFLLGAVLVVSGPTVVQPLLRQVRLRGSAGSILKWEGILIDPFGALLAVLIFEGLFVEHAGEHVWYWLLAVLRTLVVGIGLGALAGYGVAVLLRRFLIPDHLQSVFVLALLLIVFVLCDRLSEESGLLAAVVMGMVLSNQRQLSVHHILSFKEQLTVLLLAVLFVVLAARVETDQLLALLMPALGLTAILMLVVRPLVVLLCTRRKIGWRERIFIAGIAPRGIVAAAVSAFFALRLSEKGLADSEFIVPITFLVIVGSVAWSGLLARPLAAWLGLAEHNPKGVLIVGAGPLARVLAAALAEDGQEPILVDRNRERVREARLLGLQARQGDVLHRHFAEKLELERIGSLLALTRNNEVNALICGQFAEHLGTGSVYQIPDFEPPSLAEAEDDDVSLYHRIRGRLLGGADVDIERLERMIGNGAEIRRTSLTDQFDKQAFDEHYRGRSVLLYILRGEGRIHFVTSDGAVEPGEGDTLVHLAEPDEHTPLGS